MAKVLLYYFRLAQGLEDNLWSLYRPDNKVHGANMGPTWVLSVPDGPHVGPMNLVLRGDGALVIIIQKLTLTNSIVIRIITRLAFDTHPLSIFSELTVHTVVVTRAFCKCTPSVMQFDHDGLEQGCTNSGTVAMGLPQSYTKPSNWSWTKS